MRARGRINVAGRPYCSADAPFDGRWDTPHERVKSPSSQELDELENPHGENAHGRLVVVIEFGVPQQLTRAEIARARH